MLDFLIVSTRPGKKGIIEIYPKFIIKKSNDLMIRGGDFYAIWVEERGLWSTDEQDVVYLVDQELKAYAKANSDHYDGAYKIMYMWDAESGMIDSWHKYCQKQMRDNFHMLDDKLIFSNSVTDKNDYASKRLKYPLEKGDISAWDRLIGTLYTESERHKIEWSIGSIVCGDSRFLQKFMVLYGSAGTGKSTILNIIQKLFDGYYCVFDAKALGSSSNSFALEAFKGNPLVAIQHDGDLSRIEDNTRINSLVSHETMTVNEKFRSAYSNSFKCFLFMGTNKPVKITDAKSGLIRRLIDVSPSGAKLSTKEYDDVTHKIGFELGAIAKHCLDVYMEDPGAYDTYVPVAMLGASNDFYNFVLDSFLVFKKENGTTLKAAWEMYKTYCDDAKVAYPFSQRVFKEELKNYFREYYDRFGLDDGSRVRSYYSDFKTDIFEDSVETLPEKVPDSDKIQFKEQPSIFDSEYCDCVAQSATEDEKPKYQWDNVKTKLSDIDTSKVHYVRVPMNHIVIDFDIPDETGNKSFEKNLEAASKWPKTYAELSKSGQGIHLHYIYSGDPEKLSRVYDDHIEIKVFTGKSSLRRKLTKCNDIPFATISSGLPLKGDKKVVNFEAVKSERWLRTMIKRNLNKEYHPGTKPSIDFIYELLDQAYESGAKYDVSDMRNAITVFAINSTHQSDYCLKRVNKMHFCSDEPSENKEAVDGRLVFYDVEVFPNLFLVCWKFEGEGNPVVRMFNPTPKEIEPIISRKNAIPMNLIGFNCRRYDNHMMYGCWIGYTPEQLFNLSQQIIGGDNKNCFFGEAYNLSYTDIYDFASAGNKKSLKKLEIEMGIHHKELGLPWDKPVPKELWPKVGEYCDNDVFATEAAFHYLAADWMARKILAGLAGMTVNDTTNTLTTKIIFQGNRNPQNQFNYRNLAEPVTEIDPETRKFLEMACPDMMAQEHVVDGVHSILPFFPGYKYSFGVSTYKGEEVGEGGYVYSEPGMYTNIALLDISSMHPHSIIAEVLFGVIYTTIFRDIVEGRVSIKHEDWDAVREMLAGQLVPYIQKVLDGEITSKDLANALKTAINSVYGLTSAKFDNPFRDKRNVDNIVAKRGALFMVDLKHAVQERGFTVAHIKTDSIKIPNATPEIIQFVMDFGKRYGYSFEHEATYDRMCLVNKAVYIAKFANADDCEKLYGYIPDENRKEGGQWTATGAQFQFPYVFKKLFSKEEIVFEDMCETKSVTSALYLDMNENLPDVADLEKEVDKLLKSVAKFGGVTDDILSKVDELDEKIAKGHAYQFVGKVGQFCPIKPGCGGGLLMRETTNPKTGNKAYASATGSIGYRWMESEMVKELGKEDCIDRGYYDEMVNSAVSDISQYGDFEWFVNEDISNLLAEEDSKMFLVR